MGGLCADISGCRNYEKTFAEEVAALGLIQLNHLANPNGVFLDLIFSNELNDFYPEYVVRAEAIDGFTIHHRALSFKISIEAIEFDYVFNVPATKLLLRKSRHDVALWSAEPLSITPMCLSDLSNNIRERCEKLVKIFQDSVAKLSPTHATQSRHPWLRQNEYASLFAKRRVLYRRF